MSNAARVVRGPAPAQCSNDVDLRTALRHAPVLPAPATVEDLLARLDAQAVADESADLAEIILDAHYPDVPERTVAFEQAQRHSTNFFEPISRTANSNVPLPAPPRIYRSHGHRSRSYGFFRALLLLAMLCGVASFAWQWASPVEDPPSPLAASAPDAEELVTPAPDSAEIEYSGIVDFEGPEPSSDIPGPAAAGEQPHLSAEAQDPEPRTGEPSLDRESLQALVSASEEVAITRSADERQAPSRATGPYGAWAASPSACSPRMQRRGHLLTRISQRGARAGNTVCAFEKTTPRKGGYDIVASCSDGKTTWTSNVRLSVSEDRLTWTSEKGATTYVRCSPR